MQSDVCISETPGVLADPCQVYNDDDNDDDDDDVDDEIYSLLPNAICCLCLQNTSHAR